MNMQSTIPAIPLVADLDHGRMVVGGADQGKAHILHCNYYNTYLQRTLWKDASSFIDAPPIIIGAAAEQSRTQLRALFGQLGLDSIDKRLRFAEQFYAWQGFGHIDLSGLTAQGGTVDSRVQHYAEGWVAQFGKADAPVGLMTQGWLAGLADAVFDLADGSLKPSQPLCSAVAGGKANIFKLHPSEGATYPIFNAKGIGSILPTRAIPSVANNIDADGVARAVLTLPLFGNPDVNDGLVNTFDVLISWHPHGYYDRISNECLNQAIDQYGDEGRNLMGPLLEEAGHRCAFRTFGGIFRSAEWAAVVEPMCKTREDWVHGMLAIINCAGWGKASCTSLTSDEATFVVQNDYESVGYMHLYGHAKAPPNYLLRGGFRGLMNLVYNGDIASKPSLTEALYEKLHRRSDAFDVEVLTCLGTGDGLTTFRVFRKG